MLKKGLYMLPTGKIVALERVEIYENVLNEATHSPNMKARE